MNALFRSMIAALIVVNAGLYGMEKSSGAAEAVIFPGSGSSSLSSSPQGSRQSSPLGSPSPSPRLAVGCPDIDPEYFVLVAQQESVREAKNQLRAKASRSLKDAFEATKADLAKAGCVTCDLEQYFKELDALLKSRV